MTRKGLDLPEFLAELEKDDLIILYDDTWRDSLPEEPPNLPDASLQFSTH